jgi:Fic family protein
MLKYSDKDDGHKGQYKFGSNRVEAKDQSGNLVAVIFDPTPPHLVPKEMRELCDWYAWAHAEKYRHPLILIANFIFEYLAIHPFQDGNGRTSRLLTNLMMLQNGYDFTTVASHEKLIENHKADYYLALNKTQNTWKSDKEDMSLWLLFIFDIFRRQASQALSLLEGDNIESLLSEKQLELWQWATGLPDKIFTRKTAIEALGFPPRTVESIIKKLISLRKLERIGEGRSTRYRVTLGR